MDVLTLAWWIGGSPVSGPTPPVPPTPLAMSGGGGVIQTIYRQGTVPNDLAVLLMILADD